MLIKILIAAGCLAAMGAILGLALGFASKVFFMKEDERKAKIIELLPGANCGGCGYAGCANYAEAMVNDGAPCDKCPSCKEENRQEIAKIMGTEAGPVQKMVAHVRCSGQNDIANNKYEYHGMTDCKAAARLLDGFMECKYGCLGFGNCTRVCQYDAIHVENGVAVVDKEKCVGCGKCAETCPKHVIDIIPADMKMFVQCSNHEKGAITRKGCSSGCLGCKICEKTCQHDAIKVVDNVASIDFEKCTGCGECAEKCPRKIIRLAK